MSKKETQERSHPCAAFDMEDPVEAYEHMDYRIVEDYGDKAYGHYLYTWDDGQRMLGKCQTCGGYILIQSSEFHSMSDESSDSYYTDWFPVSSPEEADELNRKYDGFQIETEFEDRYLTRTNGSLSWAGKKTETGASEGSTKRSYEKYTGLILGGSGAALLILAILELVDVGMIPIIIYALAFLAALFLMSRREKSMFPQWEGLRWRIPSSKILCLLGIFVGLLLAENLMDTDAPLLIFGIFAAGMLAPLQNFLNAKKYHMDDLDSIEELTEKYPEASEEMVVK